MNDVFSIRSAALFGFGEEEEEEVGGA